MFNSFAPLCSFYVSLCVLYNKTSVILYPFLICSIMISYCFPIDMTILSYLYIRLCFTLAYIIYIIYVPKLRTWSSSVPEVCT